MRVLPGRTFAGLALRVRGYPGCGHVPTPNGYVAAGALLWGWGVPRGFWAKWRARGAPIEELCTKSYQLDLEIEFPKIFDTKLVN